MARISTTYNMMLSADSTVLRREVKGAKSEITATRSSLVGFVSDLSEFDKAGLSAADTTGKFNKKILEANRNISALAVQTRRVMRDGELIEETSSIFVAESESKLSKSSSKPKAPRKKSTKKSSKAEPEVEVEVEVPTGWLGESQKELSSIKGFTNDIIKGFTGINLAGLNAAGAVVMVANGVKECIDYTTDLGSKTRTLARGIGATAEQASTMINLAENEKIAFEDLSSSMQVAVSKGYTPTIASLEKISDIYNSLPAGIQRTKFLIDTFGDSGAKMGALMEQGSNGIEEMEQRAVKSGKVLSSEGVEGITEYQEGLEQINDWWEGLKLKIGMAAVDAVTTTKLEKMTQAAGAQQQKMAEVSAQIRAEYQQRSNEGVKFTEAEKKKQDELDEQRLREVRGMYNARQAFHTLEGYTGKALDTTQGQAKATEDAADEQNEYNNAVREYIDILGDIKNETGAGLEGKLEGAGISEKDIDAVLAGYDLQAGTKEWEKRKVEKQEDQALKDLKSGKMTPQEFVKKELDLNTQRANIQGGGIVQSTPLQSIPPQNIPQQGVPIQGVPPQQLNSIPSMNPGSIATLNEQIARIEQIKASAISSLGEIEKSFAGIGDKASYAGIKANFTRMEIEKTKSKEVTIDYYFNYHYSSDRPVGTGGGCFIGSTPVNIPGGYKPISEIVTGDEVIVYDLDSRSFTAAKVCHTQSVVRNDLVEVVIGEVTIICTPNHRFLTADDTFVEAQNLEGKRVVTRSENVAVTLVRPYFSEDFQVYNFTVDHPAHTYLVHDYVVHNIKQVAGAAGGGDISAGQVTLVGERGPEIIVPQQNNTVIPNHKLAEALGGKVYRFYGPVIFQTPSDMDKAQTMRAASR